MLTDFIQSISETIARTFRDRTGATAAIVAIALPGLIGMGAVGAETGVWLTLKIQNQSAADSAAIAAAYEVIAGRTDVAGELTAAADEAARRNGYKGSPPLVIYPYSDDTVTSGIAVTLEQRQDALLTKMFLSGITVASKAVAVFEVLNNACILALGTGGTDVQIADSVQLQMPHCSLAANSISRAAIELDSSASSIIAAMIVTAGGVSLNGTPVDPAALPPGFALSPPVLIGAPTVSDPYLGSLTHSFLTSGMPQSGRCKSNTIGGVGVYKGNCVVSGSSLTQPKLKLAGSTQIAGGWTVQTGQTVDLSPGTYWVTGDLRLQSGVVLECSACNNEQGSGVTIILTAQADKIGAVSMAGDVILNLNAPRSGPFAGLAIIQDSNDLPQGTTYTSIHSTMGGRQGISLNGLVYFPNSSLTFNGNPSSSGPQCLLLIASAVNIDAPSRLDSAGCGVAGLAHLPTISKVALGG